MNESAFKGVTKLGLVMRASQGQVKQSMLPSSSQQLKHLLVHYRPAKSQAQAQF